MKVKVLTSQELEKEFLHKIVNRWKQTESKIFNAVQKIITDVRNEGDSALIRYTREFDDANFGHSKLKVSNEDVQKAYSKLRKREIEALKRAAESITRFHGKQIEKEWFFETSDGVIVGQTTRSLSSVGVYAPGGKATYPSSVLMCTIPAKVAGVERVAVCSPPSLSGDVHPAIFVAADIGGATEIYRVGGAQAIAALAYGTETIPKVDKIIGPGNVYVTATKLLVRWDVAIDLPAGPTEIVIIADETADPLIIASDLLAQAEHDANALAILLTTSKDLALKVEKEVKSLLKSTARRENAQSCIEKNSFIIVVKDLDEAVYYANQFAPEHLEILTKKPRRIFGKIRNAGAIFLGRYSPVAFGDYAAGIDHVLPTGGFARTFSGLSVRDFVKTVSFLECSEEGCLNLKEVAVTLAKLEGLDGHVKSISMREGKIK